MPCRICNNENGLTTNPIKNEAWKLYKANWVQLDAPRHYYIHSVESISKLAHEHGFRVKGIMFNSWSFQFWGSEQYKWIFLCATAALPIKKTRKSGYSQKKK